MLLDALARKVFVNLFDCVAKKIIDYVHIDVTVRSLDKQIPEIVVVGQCIKVI